MKLTQEQIAEMVKRLRGAGKHPMMDGNCKIAVYVAHDAADMLEHLASKNIRLREVLHRLSEKNRQLNLALKEKDHD